MILAKQKPQHIVTVDNVKVLRLCYGVNDTELDF